MSLPFAGGLACAVADDARQRAASVGGCLRAFQHFDLLQVIQVGTHVAGDVNAVDDEGDSAFAQNLRLTANHGSIKHSAIGLIEGKIRR